jgi:class 3 adenylate cyclase/YHS domain-containing protein
MTDREGTGEATFAFVDLAGFTALAEAHGDAVAAAVVRRFRERAVAVLEPGDELVQTVGDEVMLRFPTPERAVRALRDLLVGDVAANEATLVPRGGAHHGTAVRIDRDYYGAAVNLASRVAGQARGGELLVTERVAVAARDAGLPTRLVGALDLRNVRRPVDVYDVRIADDRDTAVDPVCQMRVPITGDDAITLDWAGRRRHFCGLPCLSAFAANPDAFLPR